MAGPGPAGGRVFFYALRREDKPRTSDAGSLSPGLFSFEVHEKKRIKGPFPACSNSRHPLEKSYVFAVLAPGALRLYKGGIHFP